MGGQRCAGADRWRLVAPGGGGWFRLVLMRRRGNVVRFELAWFELVRFEATGGLPREGAGHRRTDAGAVPVTGVAWTCRPTMAAAGAGHSGTPVPVPGSGSVWAAACPAGEAGTVAGGHGHREHGRGRARPLRARLLRARSLERWWLPGSSLTGHPLFGRAGTAELEVAVAGFAADLPPALGPRWAWPTHRWRPGTARVCRACRRLSVARVWRARATEGG
ncbi:hypothetical protein Afil01_06340 [Actinorhabdospora filicis]|uniref:Uncharacterized protein n=1 Tax=Actinorhabdospora filicis TaxID=1785913 RepID=A0A9W6SH99_9ACTN|nr:hypothetical protein Afil01_06340 [Actinorhabdospora filicis]